MSIKISKMTVMLQAFGTQNDTQSQPSYNNAVTWSPTLSVKLGYYMTTASITLYIHNHVMCYPVCASEVRFFHSKLISS